MYHIKDTFDLVRREENPPADDVTGAGIHSRSKSSGAEERKSKNS